MAIGRTAVQFQEREAHLAPNLMHLNSPLCIQLARTFDAVCSAVDTGRYAM